MTLRTPATALLAVLLAISAVLLAISAGGLAAQSSRATLVAHVVDDSTGQPLAGAHVLVGPAGAYTDSSGLARIGRVPPGTRMVAVGMLGYGTERVVVDFTPGAEVEADIRLTIQPVVLGGLEVSAARVDPYLARNGFYQRSHFGGTFKYGQAFEERGRRVSTLHELFWGVRGIQVVTSPRGGWLLASSRGVTSFPGMTSRMLRPCYTRVLLDGMEMRYDDLDWIVPPSAVAGMEIYAGPSETPMEFGSVSPCGTVLIWTKHGR